MGRKKTRNKLGRPKKYETPGALRAGIERYFKSVSYERDVIVMRQEIVEKDGRPVLENVPEFLCDGDGERVRETVWLEEPSVEAMCVSLGISDTTWNNYEADKELGPVALAAKDLIRARLVQLLNTRNSTRGVEFNLENNFGYKKKVEQSGDLTFEVRMDEGAKELAQ